MERVSEFLEEFERDSEAVDHLVNAKEIIRKGKFIFVAYFTVVYTIAVFAYNYGQLYQNDLVSLFVIILAIISLIMLIYLIVIFIETRSYDLTEEDLVCHEFAEAAQEYEKQNTNYEKWAAHLTNVGRLVRWHDADVFSKYRTNQVMTYIERVEKTDADNVSKSSFEQFYEKILLDLLEERTGEVGELVDDIRVKQERRTGVVGVFRTSLENLSRRLRIRTLAPILAAFGVGFALYYTRGLELASFITIAILTAIGIIRGKGD